MSPSNSRNSDREALRFVILTTRLTRVLRETYYKEKNCSVFAIKRNFVFESLLPYTIFFDFWKRPRFGSLKTNPYLWIFGNAPVSLDLSSRTSTAICLSSVATPPTAKSQYDTFFLSVFDGYCTFFLARSVSLVLR